MTTRMMPKIAVIGAGSWGTTIAWLLAGKGSPVGLWSRSKEVCSSIANGRENKVYLQGVKLPENISPTNSLAEALKDAEVIVSAVPSHGLRGVLAEALPHMTGGPVVVSATKGIDEEGLKTPSGVIREVCGEKIKSIVAISGPSFAFEVSRRLPTAVTAASTDEQAALLVQKTFNAPFFRVYTNQDVIGVELGGAIKNVIALASGISDGLRLGNNARAALITRGLAEITRLGERLGASTATFSGLSGLGDLVLTCTAALSRNYSVGAAIGGGKTIKEVTSGMRMVAEGVKTSKAARELAQKNKVEMPITEAVYSVLYRGKPPEEAVYELMTRDLKGE